MRPTCSMVCFGAHIYNITCLELFVVLNLLQRTNERIDPFLLVYPTLLCYSDEPLLALDWQTSFFCLTFYHMEQDLHYVELFVDPIYPTFGHERF